MGAPADGWRPVVVTTSTRDASGIVPLWEAIEAHEGFLDRSGGRAAAERRRISKEIESLVLERVGQSVEEALQTDPELAALLDRVVRREIDPHSAADALERARARR